MRKKTVVPQNMVVRTKNGRAAPAPKNDSRLRIQAVESEKAKPIDNNGSSPSISSSGCCAAFFLRLAGWGVACAYKAQAAKPKLPESATEASSRQLARPASNLQASCSPSFGHRLRDMLRRGTQGRHLNLLDLRPQLAEESPIPRRSPDVLHQGDGNTQRESA